MSGIWDWSSTASSNTICDGLGTATGMNPANVDNVLRSIMALIRGSFSSVLQNFLAGTAALPVANGGTAATDAATALTNLGALSSAYRDLVRVDKSVDFNVVNTERGYGILWTGAAGTATIQPEASGVYNNGATYVIHNGGTGVLTISRGSGVTLRKNGSTTSADATLAIGGQATLIRWSNDYWVVNGSGLT